MIIIHGLKACASSLLFGSWMVSRQRLSFHQRFMGLEGVCHVSIPIKTFEVKVSTYFNLSQPFAQRFKVVFVTFQNLILLDIDSRKLTWIPKITVWKRQLPFKMAILASMLDFWGVKDCFKVNIQTSHHVHQILTLPSPSELHKTLKFPSQAYVFIIHLAPNVCNHENSIHVVGVFERIVVSQCRSEYINHHYR